MKCSSIFAALLLMCSSVQALSLHVGLFLYQRNKQTKVDIYSGDPELDRTGITLTEAAAWLKNPPLGGGGHQISVFAADDHVIFDEDYRRMLKAIVEAYPVFVLANVTLSGLEGEDFRILKEEWQRKTEKAKLPGAE